MADTYQHGIYITETPTAITPMITVASPTVVIGTAPVYLATNPAAVNTPVLCNTLAEFVTQFGWSDDFDSYTLCEAARVHFQLYRATPVIFINVLDENKHNKTVETVEVTGVADPITIDVPVVLSTLIVSTGVVGVEQTVTLSGLTVVVPRAVGDKFTVTAGATTLTSPTDYTLSGTATKRMLNLTEIGAAKVNGSLTFHSADDSDMVLIPDEDYTAAHDSNGATVITIINTAIVQDDTVTLDYSEIDASAVTESDIIGGVDTAGKTTGLELIEEIYPRFGLIPGCIIAPKYSTSATVAAIMKAKATAINGIFKSIAIADIPTAAAKVYTEVNGVKNQNNLVDAYLVVTWPKVALGDEQYHLSTQLAAICGVVDAAHDNLPYKSPSNESLQCDRTILADGTDIFLGKSQANYLNGVGIVTALNFAGGWRSWGNRTSIYPTSSDVKDSFIACRRFMNWIGNTLVTSFWSRVDMPINRRLVDSIVDSANIWLNGLTARGAILGGRVSFLREDNPDTNLIDGIIRFKLYVAPPPPARAIEFTLEYDVNYLSTLFV